MSQKIIESMNMLDEKNLLRYSTNTELCTNKYNSHDILNPESSPGMPNTCLLFDSSEALGKQGSIISLFANYDLLTWNQIENNSTI